MKNNHIIKIYKYLKHILNNNYNNIIDNKYYDIDKGIDNYKY